MNNSFNALHLDRALARINQDHEGIEHKIVLLHYSPIQATVEGEPELFIHFWEVQGWQNHLHAEM